LTKQSLHEQHLSVHHLIVVVRSSMFLGSAWSRFSVPACATSIASRAAKVKTGRRPPPKAARSGLEDREHGALLKQAGNIAGAGPH